MGRLNTTKIYENISRLYSTKEANGSNPIKKDNKKSSSKIDIEVEQDVNTTFKISKVHGNMAGMDKIDGMAGQTAGISSNNGKGEVRAEEGIYIYSGGCNLDKDKQDISDTIKKTDKKEGK